MELTKKDTKMLQGLSVLAMIWLHLFDRSHEGLFRPLIYLFRGIPLSFYIAQLSDFCVMGFAFCTGYAHTVTYGEKHFYRNRLTGLLRLLIKYWIIIILFSALGMIVGKGSFMPGSIRTFLGSVFLYDIGYNGAWWYMFAYTLLVLMSPLLQKAVEKLHWAVVLSAGLVLYCLGYYLRFGDGVPQNYAVTHVGPFLTTLFEYLIGSVFAKERFFSKMYGIWKRMPKWFRIVIAAFLLAAMLIVRTIVVPSLFAAPWTGIAIITLFHFWKKPKFIENVFLFIGKHSTNLWLTHMFFYLCFFKNLVYIAVYPLAIFLFMLLITLSLSVALEFAEKPIFKLKLFVKPKA